MRHLLITAYVLAVTLQRRAEHLTRRARTDERGSVTIEQVAWAVGIVAIVGLAVAAIRAYVQTQIGRL